MVEVRHDVVTRGPLDRLAALLERAPGGEVPPLAHWLATTSRRNHVAFFDFRARAPVLDGELFELCSAGAKLWVRTPDGVAMTAQLGLS